jgi:topoisomerase-4 subunit A
MLAIALKVQDKVFVGKDIIHVAVFKKNDERTVYNMIYKDGESGIAYIKRFSVVGVTRDKEYDLTKGTKGTKVLYFTANSNGEAEIVNVQLKPHSKLKKLQFDEDFAMIAIKGRGSMGNIITKYPVKKIMLKSKGVSTLAGRKIWYDDILKRLNADSRGKYLGEFDGDDRILNVLSNGVYELTNFDLNNHFDDKMILIEKYDPKKVYSVIHLDGKSKNYMVKRFIFENIAIGKQISIISDEPGSKLVYIAKANQLVQIVQLRGKEQTPETIEVNLADLIDVKGMKAMGNRLSQLPIKSVELIVTEDVVEEPEEEVTEAESDDAVNTEEETTTAADEIEPADSQEAESVKPKDEPVEPPAKPAQSPPKKVDFEITNPGDIDIDDKGQIGLF